jgi:putative ABC transport system substrate-binding protein
VHPQDRRTFLRRTAALGSILAAWPLVAGCKDRSGSAPAQAPPRVGFVGFGSPTGPTTTAFQQGLRELGLVDGRDLVVEYRFAGTLDARLPELVDELLRMPVALIVASGPFATIAARDATTTVPIVMVAAAPDPVGSGWIQSLARPGGNLTGPALAAPGLDGTKLPELLKEAIPAASRAAILWYRGAPPFSQAPGAEPWRASAQRLGLELEPVLYDLYGDLEAAFGNLPADTGGVLAPFSPWAREAVSQLVEVASRRRLPVIAAITNWAAQGALIAYGPNVDDQYRRAAAYVDKILKGRRPEDLPVELPSKFDLIINLRTARALDLTIPQSLLVQATQVLQ